MVCPLHNIFSSAQNLLDEGENAVDNELLDTNNRMQQTALVAFSSFLVIGLVYINRRYSFEAASNLTTRWGSLAKNYLSDFARKAEILYRLPGWEASLEAMQQQMLEKRDAPPSQKVKTLEEKGKGILPLRKIVACVEPAAMVNVQEIFDQYIRKKGTLLELGCGLLDSEGKSSLGRLLPNSYQRRIRYSDRFPLFSNKKRSYIQLNATQLISGLEKNSQDHIVAFCVLDCIARDLLPTVADQIHQVLKPKGKVVVLSDVLFSQSPLVKKHCTDDTIIIPHYGEHQLGINILSLQALKERAVHLGEDFSSFVEKLSDLPPKKRFELLYRMSAYDESLRNFLENICAPEHYQFIEHKESFITDLTKAFEEQGGFMILESGYREREVCIRGRLVDQENSSINYIAADLRTPKLMVSGSSSEAPPDHLVLGSTFFVFVAEKK